MDAGVKTKKPGTPLERARKGEPSAQVTIKSVGIIVGDTSREVMAAVGDGSRWGLEVTYLHQAAAVATHSTFDRLDQITAPTLVVHGEQDLAMPPQNARLLAERIPGARLQLQPGAGHLYFIDEPRVGTRRSRSWHEPDEIGNGRLDQVDAGGFKWFKKAAREADRHAIAMPGPFAPPR